jgi:hypothetical protein
MILKYLTMIGLAARHFPTLTTTIKSKKIQSMPPPAFLVLINTVVNNALLGLVFSNISDIILAIPRFSLVTPHTFHPSLLLDFKLTFDCHRIPLTPHRSHTQGDYLLLYNVLRHTDWSSVLSENSIDSAVYNLTAIMREAINVKSQNSAFPHWFYNSL